MYTIIHGLILKFEISFTRIVNIAIFVSGNFDLFDVHFDGQNECANHFAHQSVCHHRHSVKL